MRVYEADLQAGAEKYFSQLPLAIQSSLNILFLVKRCKDVDYFTGTDPGFPSIRRRTSAQENPPIILAIKVLLPNKK